MIMKICMIFNQAPKYVEAYYVLLDREFDVVWCFGSENGGIKDMDYTLLKDVRVYLTISNKLFYNLKGIDEITRDTLIEAYIIIGDFRLSSAWILPYKIKIRNPKAKILFWTHGWYGRETFLKKIMKKVFFAPVDSILLYGNHAKKLMLQEGYKEDKLFVIHNSLNYPVQKKLRDSISRNGIYKEHFGNNNPVIIMIGRLNIRKNLHMLLEAIAILKTRGIENNVTFIGDGEDKGKLVKLSEELRIDELVWFYGACYDEKQNAELIYNADLCVVPGDIGLTAIHAMMFGCPCITHNYFPNHGPEFEAITEGQTGFFYNSGSIDSLADTIEMWFNNHNDKREEVRASCYKEIDENWTPEFELKVLKKALGLK